MILLAAVWKLVAYLRLACQFSIATIVVAS